MRCLKRFFILLKMIIDLTQIQQSEIVFDEILQPSEIELDEEETELVEAVKIKGTLRKGIVQTDIDGEIKAKIETNCSRCFQKVKSDLNFPFTAAFITEEHYTKENETEIRQSDLDVSIYDGEKIDLKEIAREQILLNLPTQILCRADCKGLCEKCGANLNEAACGCEKKEIDPRWSALKNLK